MFFALAGLVVTLDQLIKIYIHTNFQLHESRTVINGFFDLTYVRNPGAAFGFLASAAPGFREIFFLSIPPIALLIIVGILRGVKNTDLISINSLALVFGGALGNYIDRLRFKFVIDFLDFYFIKGFEKVAWPAFNIADMAIVGGISIFVFLELTQKKTSHGETV